MSLQTTNYILRRYVTPQNTQELISNALPPELRLPGPPKALVFWRFFKRRLKQIEPWKAPAMPPKRVVYVNQIDAAGSLGIKHIKFCQNMSRPYLPEKTYQNHII